MSTARALGVGLVLCLVCGWVLASPRPARPTSGLSSGQKWIQLSPDTRRLQLGPFMSLLEDKEGRLGIDDVTKAPFSQKFRPSTKKVPSFGHSTSAFWIKLQLRDASGHPTSWLLSTGYWWLTLRLYTPKPGGGWEMRQVDPTAPFHQRPLAYRGALFELAMPGKGANADRTQIIYIRAQTNFGSMSLPLTLWSPKAFQAHTSDEQIGFGLFYGFFLVMILYNLFLYASLRDQSYLDYVVFILGFGLFLASNNGIAYQYLWPDSPWWNRRAALFFIGLALFGTVRFAIGFLETRRHTPRHHLLLLGALALSSGLMGVSIIDASVANKMAVWTALGVVVLMLSAIVLRTLQGSREAAIVLAAWGLFLGGGVVYILSILGILPVNAWTRYGFQLGAGLEIVLLSLALADRINTLNTRLEQQSQELATKNQELSRLDKLKDEFLANTSHELRTPINGMIGLTESLLDGVAGELPPAAREDLAMIASSGHRLAHLVNDLLDFSKLKHQQIELRRKPTALPAAANVVVALSRLAAQQKGLALHNGIVHQEGSPELPAVYADENRLQQILHNLVNNAIKFTEAGEIALEAEVEGDFLAVSVKDTGVGISAEAQERIFRSFEQADGSTEREYGGTGLGLAITRQLVELHGGTIRVESTPGEGSCFTFTLPLSEESAEAPQRSAPISRVRDLASQSPPRDATEPPTEAETSEHQRGAEERFRILVVDDEPVNLRVLQHQLSLQRYEVVQAANGREAIEVIEREAPFDLVLLDIMMPKMSGYDVCKHLRQTFPASRLPILMLTAKNQVEDLVTGFQAGANDYLTKPFSKDELLARVRTHLALTAVNRATHRFVPHTLIELLGKESLVEVQLGDHVQRTMSVLFSDIRSFTSISEKMTPRENFEFINEYLRYMDPVVQQHQGFIDKYIGDAVMALFDEGADLSVRAAISMNVALKQYNDRREARGERPIQIGVGINTGKVMLGTIGGDTRMDGTVISDAVNLAARVEGMTKLYGASVLITEYTYKALQDPEEYSIREVDRVVVKGKVQPVTVYEVFDGDPDHIKAQKAENARDFEAAVGLYRQQAVEEAIAAFERCQARHPEDKAIALYLERCATLKQAGPQQDWDGVQTLNSK